MTVEISKEEYEFLKDLQHELLTQENDCQADPIYWGIEESREVPVPEGYGDGVRFLFEGCEQDYTKEEFIDYIKEYIIRDDEALKNEWGYVDTDYSEEIVDFYNAHSEHGGAYAVETKEEQFISRDTGCFLTKRACKEYIEKYGYNHHKPHTYAMTAYRNYEYAKLLNILKTMDSKDAPTTDEEIAQKAKEYATSQYGEYDEHNYTDHSGSNMCHAVSEEAFIAGAKSQQKRLEYLQGDVENVRKKCDHFDECLQKAYEKLHRYDWFSADLYEPIRVTESLSKPVLVKNEYGLVTTARYNFQHKQWILEYGEINGDDVINSKIVSWTNIPENKEAEK